MADKLCSCTEKDPPTDGAIEESHAERRLRLRPLLSSLENRKGGSAFLDLCEMLLMLSDDIDGSIEWDHPRVLVKIRQIANANRIAKKRAAEWKGRRTG
jgi:hypothetical protein